MRSNFSYITNIISSGHKKNQYDKHELQGEDISYIRLQKKNKEYIPLQLGYFCLNTYTKEAFVIEIEYIKKRVRCFITNYWKDIDSNLFCEIDDESDLSNIDYCAVKVMLLRFHIESRSIYVILNHTRVGGGDYLELGSVMFNGTTNSLINEPKCKTLIDNCKLMYAKKFCQYKIMSSLLTKPSLERYLKERIVGTKISVDGLMNESQSGNAKRKYVLVHSIMSNIINSIDSSVNKLVCWLPLGFKKQFNSPKNNIGIILFTFVRGMTPVGVERAIKKNASMAIGSRQILIDNYKSIPKRMTTIESKIKKKIDVVLTLANIMDTSVNVKHACGGMYYKMNTYSTYPYYVWGITLDNIAHVVYNVAHKSCNIEKLVELTGGEEITDKNVFSINKDQVHDFAHASNLATIQSPTIHNVTQI